MWRQNHDNSGAHLSVVLVGFVVCVELGTQVTWLYITEDFLSI